VESAVREGENRVNPVRAGRAGRGRAAGEKSEKGESARQAVQCRSESEAAGVCRSEGPEWRVAAGPVQGESSISARSKQW